MSKHYLKPLVEKIESVLTLTNDEAAALGALPVRIGDFRKTEALIREGERPTHSFTILSGMTCMYKTSVEGRRQILIFHFAGDFPDLQSLHLNVLDMSIAAMSRTKVAFVQHHDIRLLYERFPRLGEVLWRMSLIDAAILRERMVNLGQRKALARTAHFFCEFAIRMKLAGVAENDGMPFPLTQQDIGDALGLTNIHVNRMTQQLKEEQLLEVKRGRLTVLNWERLKKAAQFDVTYLQLTPSQKRLLAT